MKQKLPAMQKMVLLTLANRYNDDTQECYPSIETLADESGMSKRAVIYQTEKLEQIELISVRRESDGRGLKKVNYYTLKFSSATDAHRSATDSLGVVQEVQKGSATDAHETVNEPVIINHKELATRTREFSDLTIEQQACFLWAQSDSYWVNVTGSIESFLLVYSKPTKRGLKAQFEEFKKTGGSNATRKQSGQSKPVSADARVQQAITKKFGNASEPVIDLPTQQYRTA